MHILNLPDEVLIHIFLYVEDVDVQNISRVNKQLRRIATTSWLWFLLNLENQLRVNHKLSKRPERIALVPANILKGANHQQLTNLMAGGAYIDVLVHKAYNIQKQIQKHRNHRILKHMFDSRPSIQELTNLFPTKIGISPNLQQSVIKLQNQLLKNRMKRLIEWKAGPSESSPKFLSIQQRIERALVKKLLNTKLKYRLNPLNLISRGIFKDPFIAPLVCPGILPKIRFYESISI
jgi:hypothetical protein